MTKLIRGLSNLTPAHQGGVVTIGNFDGLHLGHQALLARLRQQAKQFQAPSIVVIFEPQPLEFFAGNQVKIARLSNLREKFYGLAASEVDYVLVLPFNKKLAELSAKDFVATILHQHLQVKHVIVGDDFHFGCKRSGDFALLQTEGRKYHFTVEQMPTFYLNEERVSSTRLRQRLTQFDAKAIQQILGHSYKMMGRIVHGAERGRQIGFPTANIHLHRALTPVQGVFVVRMLGLHDQPQLGVANVGIRPTVDGTRSLLEVHLFNFNQDIYGRYVQVEFCAKLRDEKRFANLEALREQISQDVKETQHYFLTHGEL